MARRERMPAREHETPQVRRCRNCGGEIRDAAGAGWECECGVVVCSDRACFDEFFKLVAEGEGTRCRTCGSVT